MLKGTVLKAHQTNTIWIIPTTIRNKLTAIITRQVYVTQATFYRIVELAQSAYHRIVALETSIVGMIEIDLTTIFIQLKTSIDDFQVRMGVFERNQRTTGKMQHKRM